MLRLVWLLLKRKKKYKEMFLCITVCIFFISVVEGIYSGYSRTILDNAYFNSAKYDLSVDLNPDETLNEYEESGFMNEDIYLTAVNEVTYSVRQDKIPLSDIPDPQKEYMEYNYMSIIGIRNEKDCIQPYALESGRWPENGNEIVVSKDFVLDDGRSVRNGGINIGDIVQLEYGIRRNESGEICQDEIKGRETFEIAGVTKFKVCGIFSYEKTMTTQHICYGYYKYGTLQAHKRKLYFFLHEENYDNLQKIKNTINDDLDKEVSVNIWIERALDSLKSSDFLSSIKNGILILEAVILVITMIIIAITQYKNISEDSEQIKLLSRIGAARKHIYSVCLMANLSIVFASFISALVVSKLFLSVYGRMLTHNMLSYSLEISEFGVNFSLFGISALLITMESLLVIWIIVSRQILINEGKKTTIHKSRQPEVKNIYELAKVACGKISWKRVSNIIISVLILTVIPICFLIMIAAYNNAEDSFIKNDSDFMLYCGGLMDFKQEEELRNINGIKNISKIAMVGASRIPFSREMLGDELYNSLMNRPEYASYIDKNGDFIWTVEICFPEKDYYDDIYIDRYGADLPDYDTFASGNGVFVCINYYDTKSETIIDIGKNIEERYSTIKGGSFTNSNNMFEMRISGSVKAISTEDDAISAAIIAPMRLYYEYFDNEDYYHMITYNIDAENGSYERVKKELSNFAFENSIAFMDYYEENKEARNQLMIRMSSIMTCLFVVIFVCFIIQKSTNKLEDIRGNKKWKSFRMLGLSNSQAILLKMMEKGIYLLDAIIIALFLHIIATNTIMSGIYSYYNITFSNISIAVSISFVLNALAMLLRSIMGTKLSQ